MLKGLDALREGKFLWEAAVAADVSNQTMTTWRNNWPDFAEEVSKARDAGASQWAGNMRSIADSPDTSPSDRIKANTWLLSHLRPEMAQAAAELVITVDQGDKQAESAKRIRELRDRTRSSTDDELGGIAVRITSIVQT